MKLKKWLSTCGELSTYEDKIESSARDALNAFYPKKPTQKQP
jgi:hypothetical protein